MRPKKASFVANSKSPGEETEASPLIRYKTLGIGAFIFLLLDVLALT